MKSCSPNQHTAEVNRDFAELIGSPEAVSSDASNLALVIKTTGQSYCRSCRDRNPTGIAQPPVANRQGEQRTDDQGSGRHSLRHVRALSLVLPCRRQEKAQRKRSPPAKH